jgi:hypothetical protein
LTAGYYKINEYLTRERSYGDHLKTFPFGDYHLDAAAVECDADGKVYMTGDDPCLMADNFKEGIERIIMEDYSQMLVWNKKKKKWTADDY